MRYFVIAPDGSKFGPADIDMLRQWVKEGRISPDTMLEEEMSRKRVPARMVAGLMFGEPPGFSAASARAPRPEFTSRSTNGDSDVMWSYIYSAMTMICCCFFCVPGLVYANRAVAKGNPKGNGARIFAIIMIVLWIVSTMIMIPFLGKLTDMAKGYVNGMGG
ncbi:MAG TPA: hypothetical protein VHE55_00750 [Fimbriimonadaceae bacterium]|nr:hypothetical protein [Fimbriimonadaceae bacterium]